MFVSHAYPDGNRIGGSTISPMAERFVAVDDLVVEDLEGDMCLLRLDTSDVLVMNQTAADVWVLAADGTPADEIVRILTDHYQCSPADITDQVTSVLNDFVARGFLVPPS